MPVIEEALMGSGKWRARFRRDPKLEELFRRHRHIVVRWNKKDVYSGVILNRAPRDNAVEWSGRGLAWWLGSAERGPLIPLRRLFSGRNLLSNGDFRLDDLYWRFDENTQWQKSGSGSIFALSNFPPADDDVMTSVESFEMFPGDHMLLSARVRQTFVAPFDGMLGIYIIQRGKFQHSQLVRDPNFSESASWDTSQAVDCTIVNDPSQALPGQSRVLRMGRPETGFRQPNVVEGLNADFEFGNFAGWHLDPFTSPPWEVVSSFAHRGNFSARLDEEFWQNSTLFYQFLSHLQPGLNYEIQWFKRSSGGGPRGDLKVTLDWYEDVEGVGLTQEERVLKFYSFKEAGRDFAIGHVIRMPEFVEVSDGSVSWPRITFHYIRPPTNVDPARFYWIDTLRVKQLNGIVQRVPVQRFHGSSKWRAIVPKRRYRTTWNVRSRNNTREGEVWIHYTARRYQDDPSKGQIEWDSPAVRSGDTSWMEHEHTVETPSGYRWLTFEVRGRDIFGAPMFVGGIEMHDDDPTTLIQGFVLQPSQVTSTFQEHHSIGISVPQGSQSAHVEVIAEYFSWGWRVDEVQLRRIHAPEKAADHVRGLLWALHPDGTAASRLLNEGAIHDAGDVRFDVAWRNVMNRDALDELSSTGLVQPAREWRIHPDATLDWGLPDQIFTDRPEILLTDDDVWVRGQPDVPESHEDVVRTVKVIGAERETIGGRQVLISSDAEAPIDSVTWAGKGHPLVRTKLVEDSSVEHAEQARLLGFQHLFEDSFADHLEVNLGLNDWETLGPFDVGDWVRAYLPIHGVEDPDNIHVDRRTGRPIHPKKLRVLDRTVTYGGPQVEVFVRDENGSLIDVTWALLKPDAVEATVRVGTRPPQFIRNPQGGGVARQYLRFRGRLREG